MTSLSGSCPSGSRSGKGSTGSSSSSGSGLLKSGRGPVSGRSCLGGIPFSGDGGLSGVGGICSSVMSICTSPSRKAVASIRKNIRRRLWRGNQAPWDDVARELNRTVRGWSAYFSYGSVTKARHDVELHLYHTVRRFLRRRHKIAGPGFHQFPIRDVFGKLGVRSPASYSRLAPANTFA